MLICIWLVNFKFHRRFGLEDGMTIFLNSLFIFVVLFFIYPLKFLAQVLINWGVMHLGFGVEFDVGFTGVIDSHSLFIIYGFGGFLIWFTIILMYIHAYRKRDVLELDNKELQITKDVILANSVVCFIIICSMILAINKIDAWTGIIYMFITPLIFLVFFLRDKIFGN